VDVVDLAIKMTADADDAAAAFDKVGSSALEMADDVDRAAGEADRATRDLAGGADALATSSSQAAGGLGDLGGALALMPGPLGAVGGGMEALSPAIMGVTGASDLARLAMESSIVVNTKAKASAVAHAVATRAQAAASKVAAAGQWALNAAMNANPLGLLIAAILIVVGLFVLAYKRSETFRSIVDGAMKGATKAVGWVVDKVEDLIDWFDDALAPVGGLSDAVDKAGDIGKAAFDLWLTPLRTMIDLVKDLIDWIGKIDFPDLPDVPFLRTAGGASSAELAAAGIGGGPVMVVHVNGAVDKVGTAKQLMDLARTYGITVAGGPA
jgi:hypothetical protein